MSNLATSRTVISYDIVGSSAGGPNRQAHLDHTLETVLDQAFASVRDPRYPIGDAFRRTDGDSVTMVVDARVARAWLLADFLMKEVVIAQAEANRTVDERYRLRIRVAVDCGEIRLDKAHISGDAVTRSARLRDASALREAMANSPEADLGLIISDRFMAEVVTHGERGLNTKMFEAVPVSVKDFSETGWLYVPASPREATPPPESPRFSSGQVADVISIFEEPVFAPNSVFGVSRPSGHV